MDTNPSTRTTTSSAVPAMTCPRERKRAIYALLLITPAPSLGAAALFHLAPGTTIGYVAYAIGKIWLYTLPLFWHFVVDRGKPSWSKPRGGGLGIGLGLGVLISAGIWGTFVLIESWIDPAVVHDLVSKNGLREPLRYWIACAYIAVINAILEEYVFRWFIFRQCEKLLMSDALAVTTAAFIFTIHHVFVLRGYFDWPITLLASTGVFTGGILWSWCYLRYRSIWPGYLSHALVDIAIFIVGWELLTAAKLSAQLVV